MSHWYYRRIYGEKLSHISKYYKPHFGTLYFGDVEVGPEGRWWVYG